MTNIKTATLALVLFVAGSLTVFADQKGGNQSFKPYLKDTDIHTLCKAWENGEITIYSPYKCLALGYDPDRKDRRKNDKKIQGQYFLMSENSEMIISGKSCKTVGGCIPYPPPKPCIVPIPCPKLIKV